MFSLMKVCAYTTRIWGPNVKSCGVLITFPRFVPGKDCLESKLSNESVSIITHNCDLKKLFPGNPLTEDN